MKGKICTEDFLNRLFASLFVWVLWPINLCRSFNAKSIFIEKTVLFQTLQFSISHHHHHHHIVLEARISVTLSRHSSLSFITLGRSSGQQPVSSHSCWMYVRAGRPAFARPCVGIHKSTSLMSSSLLLQQCPACLVRLTWIVFRDRGQVAVQLVSCGVLLPGLVQDCTQHSCAIAI